MKNEPAVDQAKLLRVVEAGRREGVLFPELALSLLTFVHELHERFSRKGSKDLLFLSREGFILKELYEKYLVACRTEPPMRTHYFKASRRSTFLLSLRELQAETFEVLFRQYVRISVQDFLRSLDLQSYSVKFAKILQIEQSEFMLVRDHLPSDPLFRRLIAHEEFRKIYELERRLRSSAFEAYVKSFFAGELPSELHLVDVGWKGSIQDNIFNWFTQKAKHGVITGYYIGLVAPGLISKANGKQGLLFDSVVNKSSGFRVFNENRSLFEVFLPAPHGSPVGYRKSPDSTVEVLHDDFPEREFIEGHVRDATEDVIRVFEQLLEVVGRKSLDASVLRSLAVQQHARMVYDATQKELEWISAAEHAESFGVFSTSTFVPDDKNKNFLERFTFTMKLLRHRRLPDAHWPWFELRRSALPGTSRAYAISRLVQERLGKRFEK